MKTCVRYCRVGSTEFLPGNEYKIEFNPIDRQLRIYTVWGNVIVSAEFIKWQRYPINNNFI